jgi:transposase InsO family protein
VKKVIMNDTRFTDITQLTSFLQGTKKLGLTLPSIEDKYIFITDIIKRFSYFTLKKKEKRIVFLYIKKITGYKKAQLYRLIKRSITGDLHKSLYHRKHVFRIYDFCAIKLLEHTDELHLRLSREATLKILQREYELFHHKKYQTIASISPSHIGNLRKTQTYKSSWINGTKARLVPIGETMKPKANNMPGSLRIDTVHQRDVYHINCVDEITQWEIVVCVPQISEAYLKPALEELLDQFPFIVFNFHSDRGGEFINKVVAKLLNKLLIHQTKSRSRHCNDNALVESKNGMILRKNMGYFHINKDMTGRINTFYKNYFNVYLNYHRSCGYVTETKIDSKGRERKIYGQYTVPYEKLKEVSIHQKKNFLKPCQSFEKLDRIAYEMSDNDFAERMREKQRLLIKENLVIDR